MEGRASRVIVVGAGAAGLAAAARLSGRAEATAGDHAGTVEGALRSGERAAREALESVRAARDRRPRAP